MQQSDYWRQIHSDIRRESESGDPRLGQALTGYILEQPVAIRPGLDKVWGYVVAISWMLNEPTVPYRSCVSLPSPSARIGGTRTVR